jgi:hypothetical protein
MGIPARLRLAGGDSLEGGKRAAISLSMNMTARCGIQTTTRFVTARIHAFAARSAENHGTTSGHFEKQGVSYTAQKVGV